ncbi:hypothetical protein [Propioniciclava flava]
MIVAMGVLMVPIALIVAFFTRTPEPVVQHLDYAPVARLAAGEATFPCPGACTFRGVDRDACPVDARG